ncbi:MAG: hypothetical protein HYV07_18840 [Deltaproteobacteria bacterium]|nr:hypothetical protein [Deltaproteobacteria bacterium]
MSAGPPGDFRKTGSGRTTTSTRITEIFGRTAFAKPGAEITAAMARLREHPEDADAAAELARLWLAKGSPEVALSWAYRAAHLSKGDDRHRKLITQVSAAIEAVDSLESEPVGWSEAPLVDHDRDTELSLEAALLGGAGLASPAIVERVDPTAQVERARRNLDPMEALLGASLFPRESPRTSIFVGPVIRGRKPRAKALVMLATFIALGAVGWQVVAAGLERQAQAEAVAKLAELENLTQVGSFHLVAPLIDEVRALGSVRLEEVDPRSIPRAEALVFRHFDASQERIDRVRAAASRDAITEAALLPRAAQLDLAGYRAVDAATRRPKGDADARYLVALALARMGAMEAASTAFASMESAEPSHLPHLYAWARHEARRGRNFELANVVEAMNDADPKAPWTRLAAALVEADEALPSLREVASASVAAVPRAWAHLAHAEALARVERKDEAKLEIAASLEAVWESPVFAMDFAEALLDDGFPELATHVVTSKAWPIDDAIARSISAQVDDANEVEGALDRLRAAYEQRPEDPRVGIALAEAIETSGAASDKPASAYFGELATKWPELQALTVQRAAALFDERDPRKAEQELDTVRKKLTDPDALRAAMILEARLLAARGATREARSILEKLAEEDSDDENVAELLEGLDAPPEVVVSKEVVKKKPNKKKKLKGNKRKGRRR